MKTEEEEIREELAAEGIVEEPAAVEAPAADTEPELPLRGSADDVVDASGEPEEPEVEVAPEVTAPREIADPRDAAIQELRSLVQGQQSKLAELERGGFRHAPLATDADAEILSRDPNTFQTVGELNDYWSAKNRAAVREAEQRAQVAGRIASAEQHARGLLSVEACGEGYDFDSLLVKHIIPLERESPEIAELLQRLPGDPAMNRFTLALVREVQSLAGKEPAKAVKMIRQALTGTKQGEKTLLAKITSASRKQADRIRGAGGLATVPKTKLRQGEDVWDMDEAAFARLDAKNSG